MARNITKSLTPAIALLIASSPAYAQPLTWDYASMSLLVLGEFDNGTSENLDKGFRFDAARTLNELVFLRAKVDTHDFDDAGIDTLQWGGGVRFDLEAAPVPLQLWAGLNFERLNIAGGVSDGIGIDLGARAAVARDLEAGFTYKTANLTGANSIEYDAIELSVAYTGLRDFDVIGTINNAGLDDDIEGDLEHIAGVGIRVPF